MNTLAIIFILTFIIFSTQEQCPKTLPETCDVVYNQLFFIIYSYDPVCALIPYMLNCIQAPCPGEGFKINI